LNKLRRGDRAQRHRRSVVAGAAPHPCASSEDMCLAEVDPQSIAFFEHVGPDTCCGALRPILSTDGNATGPELASFCSSCANRTGANGDLADIHSTLCGNAVPGQDAEVAR